MNNSNNSAKTIYSNLSNYNSSKSYHVSGLGLNKLSSFNNRIWHYGLHQRKIAKKFSSKMAMSTIISRKSQTPSVHFDKEENKDSTKQSTLSIPSHKNSQLNGAECRIQSQPIEHYASNITPYNTEHCKPRLRRNGTVNGIHGSSECSVENEIFTHDNSREIVVHKLLPTERQRPCEQKLNNSHRCTVTSESFLPTYLETVQNDTHFVSPPRSHSVCTTSDDRSEFEENDFVLNISKNPNDNYMSALDLIRGYKVPLNTHSITHDSMYVTKYVVENCGKEVNCERYASHISTEKSECNSDDCSNSSTCQEIISVDGDDLDDGSEECDDYSYNYEEDDERIETTVNEYVKYTKSQMILQCSETVLKSEFINDENVNTNCKTEDELLEDEISDTSFEE